ncbi:hypothetical protein EYF80_028939 [Liparis tanakae]|uniref:Uncharacterized protein n=1 Tax=Liparis tanakae TaxID=230148 RepID=A0A4Z2H7V1_9TELE|nr:hypothetical protein EYF80_028939 [Liparis tanakae]
MRLNLTKYEISESLWQGRDHVRLSRVRLSNHTDNPASCLVENVINMMKRLTCVLAPPAHSNNTMPSQNSAQQATDVPVTDRPTPTRQPASQPASQAGRQSAFPFLWRQMRNNLPCGKAKHQA